MGFTFGVKRKSVRGRDKDYIAASFYLRSDGEETQEFALKGRTRQRSSLGKSYIEADPARMESGLRSVACGRIMSRCHRGSGGVIERPMGAECYEQASFSSNARNRQRGRKCGYHDCQ